MGESQYGFAEGTGRAQHTWQRNVGGTAVEDMFVVQGIPVWPTYAYASPNVITSVANSHLLQVMAGASNRVGIRRIVVSQTTLAGAVSPAVLELRRLTTAGTGGTAGTAVPYDPADAAAGATIRYGGTSSKGTEGSLLWREGVNLLAAATGVTNLLVAQWDFGSDISKLPWIAAGTANGMALKCTTAVGTATVAIDVEFIEMSYT